MTPEPIETPEPYGSLIDKVNDRDREWFLAHPGAKEYTRPYVPGEMWPYFGNADVTRVEQVAPGVRIRRPVWRQP